MQAVKLPLLMPGWPISLLLITVLTWLSPSATAAVILQYHHVSDESPPLTSISPALFAQHLEYIEVQGFEVWPLPQLVDSLKANQTLPDKVVSITFDDAYASIYEHAYPLLKRRGWPFTVFVATEPVHAQIPGFMSWQQLRAMAANGATIANHTHSHTHLVRRLPQENERQWLTRVEKEILGAQSILASQLGQQHKLLAYPYGEYDDRIAERVAARGFIGFGQQSGAVRPGYNLSALPRFPMNNHFGAMTQFPTKLSSLPLRLQAITPERMILTPDRPLPSQISLLFDPEEGNHRQLRCYLSYTGDAKLEIAVSESGIEVKLSEIPTPPVGRSRINCTMPSQAYPGRFRWYSWFWMRTQSDGSWYPEP